MKTKANLPCEWLQFTAPYFLCEWCGRYFQAGKHPVSHIPAGPRSYGYSACIECCPCPHTEHTDKIPVYD